MINKKERILVYPADLKIWASSKSDKSVYRLYHQIQEAFNLDHSRDLTIFHLRDYFKISLEDIRNNL